MSKLNLSYFTYRFSVKSLLLLIALTLLYYSAKSEEASAMIVEINGGISPSTAEHIQKTLLEARDGNYSLYILQLDTPGGLLEATRDIVSDLLQSDIPSCVYIGPSGARAGSAGAFISLAADIVAMAPGTNIGAAHPVGLGGESGDSTETMTQKITNDAAALMRSIAKKRGRNQEIAESMVRQSTSISEDEAIEAGIADFIAENIPDLLSQLQGFTISSPSRKIVLPNNKISSFKRETKWHEEFLMGLADPNIAYIFILLAGYGILIELYNPGSIFPGAVGVVSALLAAYSLQMLPTDWVGLGLIISSAILLLLEAFVTSYGLLSLGAIATFFIGSVMLFDTPSGFFDVSRELIYTLTTLIAITAGLVIFFAIRSQSRKRISGKGSLVGETGRALTDFEKEGKGKIRFHGENWKAINTGAEIAEGETIIVTGTEGLTAFIKKK